MIVVSGSSPLRHFVNVVLCVTTIVNGLTGCRSEVATTYPKWVKPELTFEPEKGSSNGFSAYALAALDAEQKGAKYLKLVSFTPQRRLDAMAALEPAIEMVRSGSTRKFSFWHAVHGPFEPVAYRAGWRLIGRVIAWRVERALVNGDFELAVREASVAIKFGMHLTGGDVMDATLGLGIVDEVRRRLAHYLDRMDSDQLWQLSLSISRSLANNPPIKSLLDNERKDMLMAVQTIQDHYRDRNWDGLEKQLGSGVKPAIEHLRQMVVNDSTRRLPYFEGFADEAEREILWLSEVMPLPTSLRKPDKPQLAKERPWQRFSKSLFQGGRAFMPIMDRSMALTRLFALECGILAKTKKAGSAPATIPVDLQQVSGDPYSGEDFIFRAEGRDYRLYSVGENLRDDGGQANDLFVEGRS